MNAPSCLTFAAAALVASSTTVSGLVSTSLPLHLRRSGGSSPGRGSTSLLASGLDGLRSKRADIMRRHAPADESGTPEASGGEDEVDTGERGLEYLSDGGRDDEGGMYHLILMPS